MLEIKVEESEFYQASSNTFISVPECTLTLEHSLISVAKWEARWQKPYFDEKEKTKAQDLDYIRCMVIGTVKNENVFDALTFEHYTKIKNYIANPMTATTFQKHGRTKTNTKEVMTAEIIYSHMFAHNISIECQKWHLNRLLTLIKVCSLQSAPKEKMSKKQTAMWNAEQNAARKAKLNTRG
jgi:hypothetical protein